MNWLDLIKNWKTTLGGIMVSVPPLISAAGFVVSPTWNHWLALCSGLGALLVGLAAKDATTHSTVAQVEKATVIQEKEDNPTPKVV